jgi:diaminopropionate ammonia-lyase
MSAPLVSWYARPAARAWRCAAPSEAALAFHRGLPGYRPTPLVDLPSVASEWAVGRVLVKDESSRLGLPAFKVLGASWAVARVLARRAGLAAPAGLDGLRQAMTDGPLTLVTATDGNHGRAVARMASLVGAHARVIVPRFVPERAATAIAAEGATVVRTADDYDQAVEQAAAWAAGRTDAVLVQDVAWPGYEEVAGWIVEGYATLLLEIDAELAALGMARPDLVVVPVGVGSLAQAVLAHYRSRPAGNPAVLSVEPEAAACVLASLRAGEPRSVPTADTVMAGLNCGTPSGAAWPYLRDGLDAAIAIFDSHATRAVDDLGALGVSSGPSGAAALAGARAALTGPGAAGRRAQLGVDNRAVVVLLNTEGDHRS